MAYRLAIGLLLVMDSRDYGTTVKFFRKRELEIWNNLT